MGTNALALFVVSGWLVKTLLVIPALESAGRTTTLYRWIYVRAFAPLAPPLVPSGVNVSPGLHLPFRIGSLISFSPTRPA